MLVYIISGFLMHRCLTGYEIKQVMQNSTSNFMDASFGSIYPALKRMENDGWVISSEQVEGGRNKKVYRLTPAGSENFLAWLRTPPVFSPFHNEHLARMFFYRFLDPAEAREMIESFIPSVQAELDKLLTLEKHRTKMDTFEYATLCYGKHLYETIMSWYQDFLKTLQTH